MCEIHEADAGGSRLEAEARCVGGALLLSVINTITITIITFIAIITITITITITIINSRIAAKNVYFHN